MIDLTAIRARRDQGENEAARQQLNQLAAQFPHDAVVQHETACVYDFVGLERESVPFYLAIMGHGLVGTELRSAYLGLGSTYRHSASMRNPDASSLKY